MFMNFSGQRRPHAIQKENENDIRTENEIENEIGKGPRS